MVAKAASEGFYEVESADEALDRIASFDEHLRNDIGFAYSDEFIKAAAALAQFDEGAFARLSANLKSRGLADRSRWEETARRMLRQELERLKLLRAIPQGQSGGDGTEFAGDHAGRLGAGQRQILPRRRRSLRPPQLGRAYGDPRSQVSLIQALAVPAVSGPNRESGECGGDERRDQHAGRYRPIPKS
jgi:hypothetical protein